MSDAPRVQGPQGDPPYLHHATPLDFFPEALLVALRVGEAEVVLEVTFRGRALCIVALEVDVSQGVREGDRVSILADQDARLSVRRLQGGP